MSTVKQYVKGLIDHLPEDASIEDIQYHLYVGEGSPGAGGYPQWAAFQCQGSQGAAE